MASQVRVRNTFLEVTDADVEGGPNAARRTNSDPTSSSASSKGSSMGSSGQCEKPFAGFERRVFPSDEALIHVVFDSSGSSTQSGTVRMTSPTRRDAKARHQGVMDWDAITAGGHPSSSGGAAASSDRGPGAASSSSPAAALRASTPTYADESADDNEGQEQQAAETGYVRELYASLSPQEIAELTKQIPIDDKGNLTSVGSVGHAEGDCTPCVFLASRRRCVDGMLCSSCHFPHGSKRRNVKGQRPSKGKRDRYRNLTKHVMHQIEQDPDAFDPENIEMPPSVAANEVLKRKFLARMQKHAEYIKWGGPLVSAGNSGATPLKMSL